MSDTQSTTIEAVYEANVEKLYKFFYFKVLDKQVAEDMTRDTFLALAEKVQITRKRSRCARKEHT